MTAIESRTSLLPKRRGGSVGSFGKRLVVILALPTVLIATWWFLSADSESFFFPPLSKIAGSFSSTWLQGRLGSEVLPSVTRLLIGYSIAVVLGVALGVLIGLSSRLRAFAEPPLEFFRAIPPPVLVPVLMLFFGIFTTMKVVVIATGCLWPILLNTIEGVRGMDEVLRDTGRIYRLRRHTYIRKLVLRSASPQIMTGARQGLSLGIILMVISEMFAANNGLGFTIVQFQRSFAVPQMWTGIILLGILGVTLSVIFRAVERPILSWHRGLRQSQRGGN